MEAAGGVGTAVLDIGRLAGLTMYGTASDQCRSDWQTLLSQHAEEKITPLIGARRPLTEVAEAHRMMDATSVVGKIVLTA